MIREILGQEHAILLQNAFPTLEKYIDHVHVLENRNPAKVIDTLKEEILLSFKNLLKMKKRSKSIFYKY